MSSSCSAMLKLGFQGERCVEQYASLRRRDREKPQHKANDMRPQACHENASVFTHASPVLGAGSRLRR